MCLESQDESFRGEGGPEVLGGGSFDSKSYRGFLIFTLPETNIAPENEPLEKEIPMGYHHF